MFKVIALELENQDPYQYLRAYSAGLQEFVEAMTLSILELENHNKLHPYSREAQVYDNNFRKCTSRK